VLFFDKDSVDEFVKRYSTAVLSTVDEKGQPSSSTIFYTMGKNSELWFLTKSDTTKYINLQQNNKAALTIVDPQKPIAINMQGRVVEVSDTGERDSILQAITKLSSDTLHDYAPIIKLHKGSFKAMRFLPEQAKMTDYTKPLGQAGETLKKY
jgi:uncharacterized pyridoxamine 5'-phosphate oxidase family protein